jgi:DNA-binding MarR family transcriptional regulator
VTLADYMAPRDRIARQLPFPEAARNILFDLALSRRAGREVSVSSACLASGVPSTTALRHIQLLVHAGLAERVPHARDGRSVLLQITDDALARVEALFASSLPRAA